MSLYNHLPNRAGYPEVKATVRPMTGADLDRIMYIEHFSFSTPWSRQSFVTELKDNEYARYFCLELEEKIIGYMGLWLILDEGHITNVAIEPEHRGQGWGHYLMRSVIAKMKDDGVERMTLEVRVSNLAARHLYEALGFKPAGVRKGYYADTGEDAIILWLELD